MVTRRMLASSLALVCLSAVARGEVAETPSALGSSLGEITLSDAYGEQHSLSQDKHQVVVLAFLGTECPLARLYAPRLADLAKQYEPRGVAFYGVIVAVLIESVHPRGGGPQSQKTHDQFTNTGWRF
jgi:thiol-disulfide isomerase/thioredoxin